MTDRQSPIQVSNLQHWAEELHAPGRQRPLLVHLNADTTWLVQLPYPSASDSAKKRPRGRTHYNVLFDPWFAGPQSDVASWFSTQWHVVAPSVVSIAELNAVLREVERRGTTAAATADGSSSSVTLDESLVDAVVISHEFTDHCHKATLLELPKNTPVFAADVAADLVRSWDYFDQVVTLPVLSPGVHWSRLTSFGSIPEWIGIGRVESVGNALYYHSAIFLAFDLDHHSHPDQRVPSSSPPTAEAIIYSPHGINSADLAAAVPSSGARALALLHGLHDVRIWMTKQLNLGALNGIRAVAASGARYWVATHDEVKTGGGLIAPFLTRTRYSLKEAVAYEQARLEDEGKAPEYVFRELGSGDGLVLES